LFFSVEMRWVMVFFVIMDLHPVLLALAGEHLFSQVANAAHLGGLAFGFLYAWRGWRLEPLLDRAGSSFGGLRRRNRFRVVRPERVPDEDEPTLDRVDELLRKIGDSGQGSLTEDELTFLRHTSARLRSKQERDE
jgi:Rhomboid family